MENNKGKSQIFLIIVSVFFGIIGGVGAEILIRFYVLEDLYKIPLFGEISVPENVYGGSNLIIDSPKKVIVEQNIKVLETLSSVNKNIFAIHNKVIIGDPDKKIKSTSTKFNLNENYDLNNYLGQGFVATSDGWLMSGYLPEINIENGDKKNSSSSEAIKKYVKSNFVIINNEGKIYPVIDVVIDKARAVSFWQVSANDLAVRRFAKMSDIKIGQLVLATNFKGSSLLTTVSEKHPDKNTKVFSSDKIYTKISLVNDPQKNINEGFLFNIEGDLIAIIKNNNEISPVNTLFSCLKCLFDKRDFSGVSLGINYINLFGHSNPSTGEKYGEGIMIYKNDEGLSVLKNSPADLAGLKEGDIILAVNAIKINRDNNFSDIISEFNSGDKLSFTVKRGVNESEIVVVLGSSREIDASTNN